MVFRVDIFIQGHGVGGMGLGHTGAMGWAADGFAPCIFVSLFDFGAISLCFFLIRLIPLDVSLAVFSDIADFFMRIYNV